MVYMIMLIWTKTGLAYVGRVALMLIKQGINGLGNGSLPVWRHYLTQCGPIISWTIWEYTPVKVSEKLVFFQWK